jgi:hypothetical protein
MIKINTQREYTFPVKNDEGETEATVTLLFPVKTDIEFNKVIGDLRKKYVGQEDEESIKVDTYLMMHNVFCEMITGWTGFVIDENDTPLEFNDENRALVYDYICSTNVYNEILETYYSSLKKN